jgi:hypothetical protein
MRRFKDLARENKGGAEGFRRTVRGGGVRSAASTEGSSAPRGARSGARAPPPPG